MSQFNEPWEYYDKGHFVRDSSGACIIDGTRFRLDRHSERVTEIATPEELRRIVACVNACRGIPTEHLQLLASPGFDWLAATLSIYIKTGIEANPHCRESEVV
jgi:hypothetical protein